MIVYILIVFFEQQLFACLTHIGQTSACCQAPRVMFAAPNRISAKIAYTAQQNQMTCKYRHFLGMIFFS